MRSLTTLADGTVVLADLQWQVSVDGYGPTQLRVLATAAEHEGFLLRADDRNVAFLPQGFAGQRVVAFAAVIADAICGEAFAGVFHSEGVWVYVAATDEGYILADGDRVFDNAEAAQARLDQERGLYARIYAPAEWNQEGTHDSGSVLSGISWVSAQPFEHLATRQMDKRKLGLGVAAAAAVVAGLGWHFLHAQDVPVAPVGLPAPAPPPPDPWRSAVKPEAAAQACLAARVDVAEAAHQGWMLKDMVCDVAARTVSATLSPYTLANQVPTLAPSLSAKLAPDGATIIVTGKLDVSIVDRSSEKPSSTNTIDFRNFIFSFVAKPVWQEVGKSVKFEINTDIPLPVISNGMEKFNTLIVDRIYYLGDKWRVQGTISN